MLRTLLVHTLSHGPVDILAFLSRSLLLDLELKAAKAPRPISRLIFQPRRAMHCEVKYRMSLLFLYRIVQIEKSFSYHNIVEKDNYSPGNEPHPARANEEDTEYFIRLGRMFYRLLLQIFRHRLGLEFQLSTLKRRTNTSSISISVMYAPPPRSSIGFVRFKMT